MSVTLPTASCSDRALQADVVIVGKQAIDGDNCQTGPMIAGVLNWSQCSMANELNVTAEVPVVLYR